MVRKQLARQEIITPPETAKQLGQRDLLVSMTIDQDFPEKVTHCRHVFLFFFCFFFVFFLNLDRSAERGGRRHNNEQSYRGQRKNL